ncbi:MND1-interacting protein 1 [Apostasia shenzhenica]|uniref:MND1-interacting protein 1 n=1 Tax=Apostasia shenzhenica TaxID=1088818 RepID=A0A2I0AYQ6_9ASPA|nr:MND1-interacting protein 1 [Apostasia shenzhenica]
MGLNGREKPLRPGGLGRKRHVPRPALCIPSDSSQSKIAAAAFSSPVASADPSTFSVVDPAFAAPGTTPNLNLNIAPFSGPNPNANPSGFDESGWGYCTEEQLEEIVINNLDCVYKEAISRLVSLGYEDTAALRAVLCNGHCCGSMDPVSNIIQNAVAYLNNEAAAGATVPVDGDPPASAFSDLRHLEEYSLAGMVCLLQQVRPDLSRGEAMWCLLMSGLHVNRASSIELPSLPPPANPQSACTSVPFSSACTFSVPSWDSPDNEAANANASFLQTPESVNRFDSPAALKTILKQQTSEYCTVQKMPVRQRQPREEEAEDLVQSVLKKLELMSIEDEKHPDKEVQDQKKEMIMDLIRQIRELEGQVKERKEWAQQKAMQAARKLSNDLNELRVLRLEREENQRVLKGKQALEDSTMKRLAEMESALKKASGQVDRANAVVRKLEIENAEIRAEMEASKLSASESVTACMEVTKREKKCLKKVVAWEKQNEKIQEEITEKRKKAVQVKQQLAELQEATEQAEIKWKQEMKAKEESLAVLDEERRAKEAAEVSCKRRLDDLRQKIELDFQRYKDDVKRLEEELSRLRSTAAASRLNPARATDLMLPLVESNPRVPPDPGRKSPRRNDRRVCCLCRKDEVSVVFLPCAHQIVCSSCNEYHLEKGKDICMACSKLIKERIRVFGASS